MHISRIVVYAFCFLTLASTITMLALMDIAGLYLLIPVGTTLMFGSIMLVMGKDVKWFHEKLIFAVDENALYFTSQSGDGSFFEASYHNINGYTVRKCGKYHNVTVFFREPEGAGSFGNLKYLKMIRIERFEQLRQVFESHGISKGKK